MWLINVSMFRNITIRRTYYSEKFVSSRPRNFWEAHESLEHTCTKHHILVSKQKKKKEKEKVQTQVWVRDVSRKYLTSNRILSKYFTWRGVNPLFPREARPRSNSRSKFPNPFFKQTYFRGFTVPRETHRESVFQLLILCRSFSAARERATGPHSKRGIAFACAISLAVGGVTGDETRYRIPAWLTTFHARWTSVRGRSEGFATHEIFLGASTSGALLVPGVTNGYSC